MPEDSKHDSDPTILEAARLIREFKENFAAKTSNSDGFMTINELEKLWSELRKGTDVLYSDMIHQLMGTIDERDMISKKKENLPSLE
jgi:Ca2+-binding EF-hand superfamily protein